MTPLRNAWLALDRFFWADADGRVYSVVRIAFCLAALVNWVELFRRRDTLFGPRGIIGYDAVAASVAGQPYFSVFSYVGTDTGVTAIFIAALAAIVSLGVGWRTRVSALPVYVWHLSYTHVMFPSLSGWDTLLRVYSLLLLISPAPTIWSLDARRLVRRGETLSAPPIYGLRLMQLQLLTIYLSTAWLKVADPNWRNGDLVALFQMSMYSRFPDSQWLAQHAVLTNLATYGSLVTEAIVVPLLWNRRLRAAGLVLGIGLHSGIALTSSLIVFSMCVLAPYCAFLSRRDIESAVMFGRRGLRAGATKMGGGLRAG